MFDWVPKSRLKASIKASVSSIFLALAAIWLNTNYKTFFFQVFSKDRGQKQSSGGVLKKGVLRNFAKFAGKHLRQSLFFNKVAGLRPPTSLKKRLWHRYFLVNFAKFIRTPFFTYTSGGWFWEVYLEPSQISQMELFVKIVNDLMLKAPS